MRWFGITGSWRTSDRSVEADVRDAVCRIMAQGDGIVTGGALNVDWFATDEALQADERAERIRVCLPSKLNDYIAHYHKRAREGVIGDGQAMLLEAQLLELFRRNNSAIIEGEAVGEIDKKAYFERNSAVVDLSDEVLAFQVNDSEGVQDTVDKARAAGKPVSVSKYYIEVGTGG